MVKLFRTLHIFFLLALSAKGFSAEESVKVSEVEKVEKVTEVAEVAKVAEVLEAVSPVSTSNMIMQVLIALAIVTAAILALAWVVKRLGNTHLLQQRDLKVLSTMPLGTREKVILIEVENQKILLGVTPSNISTLHVFSTTEETSESKNGDSKAEKKAEKKDNKRETINPSPNEKWDFTRYFKKVVGDNRDEVKPVSNMEEILETAGIDSLELSEMNSLELSDVNSLEQEEVKNLEYNEVKILERGDINSLERKDIKIPELAAIQTPEHTSEHSPEHNLEGSRG